MFVWLLNASGGVNGVNTGNLGADWQILDGSADHNGDGTSDLVMRQTNGDVSVWLMDGSNHVEKALPHLDNAGSLVSARGDYNADGISDVMWRHTDGTVLEWLMDSVGDVGASNQFSVDTTWSIVDAVGDRDANGSSDVLWRSSGGTDERVFLWHMDPTSGSLASGHYVGGAVTSDWQIA
ncbi:MAG TPA: hypothetical protein VHP37_28840 [Burkholderiales bacterium]|nr:hypothetical protein [Burkholderiales bacterium]